MNRYDENGKLIEDFNELQADEEVTLQDRGEEEGSDWLHREHRELTLTVSSSVTRWMGNGIGWRWMRSASAIQVNRRLRMSSWVHSTGNPLQIRVVGVSDSDKNDISLGIY